MADENKDAVFLPLRKKKNATPDSEAWEMLCARETLYGFLGLHGVKDDEGMPYVVPLNFAAAPAENAIYFHTTVDADSKRNRALAEDGRACFTVAGPESELVSSPDGVACRFTMKFTSVMAFGTVEKVEAPAEKAMALNLLMEQKSGFDSFMKVPEQATMIANVYKLKVAHISGARKV